MNSPRRSKPVFEWVSV